MYDNQAFQPGQPEHSTTTAPLLNTTATEPMLLAETTQPIVKLGTSTLILVPFGLIALWTIALACFKQQEKRQNHERKQGIGRQPFQRMPCRSCMFFKSNPYVKCAVNPIDALTTKAIDCADYAPHKLPSKK